MHTLIPPYGEKLMDLMAGDGIQSTVQQQARKLTVMKLDPIAQSDLELLLTGAFSPLSGYMGQADYLSVLNNMRLSDGRVWPLPLTLVIPIRLAQSMNLGQQIALSDARGELLAVVTVSEIYRADLDLEVKQLGATLDFSLESKWYVAGSVIGLGALRRFDFRELRLTPAQLRSYFHEHGWSRVVAYQSAQPLHRAAYEFVTRTAAQNQAGLLIQALVGGNASESVEYYPLIRGYQAVMSRLSSLTGVLSLLSAYPRRGGIREILLRAILVRNYGCSHLIVGGESSGHGQMRRGSDLLDGQVFLEYAEHIKEIGVALIPYPRMVYVEERAQFMPLDEAPKETYKQTLSADEVRRRLRAGLVIPEWYMFPDVLTEMRHAYQPPHTGGFAIMMTGMAGVGKTTLAHALGQLLMARGNRKVTVLDNELLLHHPSMAGDYGILGFMMTEIVRHQGIAICAVSSPVNAARREVRKVVQQQGGYLELYLTASVQARSARVVTKSDDNDYEVPEQADLIIDTSDAQVSQSLQMIILKLEQEGLIR